MASSDSRLITIIYDGAACAACGGGPIEGTVHRADGSDDSEPACDNCGSHACITYSEEGALDIDYDGDSVQHVRPNAEGVY